VFTAQYALSPYIKQIRVVFKGLSSPRLLLHSSVNLTLVAEATTILQNVRTTQQVDVTSQENHNSQQHCYENLSSHNFMLAGFQSQLSSAMIL
jgi:hypothetical protein